ncbi:ribose-phosphate pyrophosphokinase [Silvibacterium dinghuense]|uniref:Ribose-phosphate pyrophosphokinase n=1 Tax=Silvibacterium dinghuense TaxID=1560006 RepID=A0A4Q1S9P6_9BACT|nr:ribose-phosphate pyrophosphokinase [Silvibacterium dinghuense]
MQDHQGQPARENLVKNETVLEAEAVQQPEGEKKPVEKKRGKSYSEDKRFKIFSGSANRELATEICKHIGVALGETKMQRFADGEVYFQLLENVRGADVFVVQPTCNPVDQHLVELLIMIDALKRASAGRITVVVPYYGYARQDRKDRPRVAISSKLVADLLTTAGANRALFMDLHAAQIQGFFNIPVDHMFASPVMVGYFRELNLPNLTVVSPDAGGVERARFFATKIGAPLAIVDKRRTDINVTEVMHVIGDVEGRSCLILDDIVDTAGTLVKTVDALLAKGATQVYACASHAVLSGPAIERIAKSKLVELVVTDSIPLTEEARKMGKIKVRSVAGLLAATIESIHMETSVSSLFN